MEMDGSSLKLWLCSVGVYSRAAATTAATAADAGGGSVESRAEKRERWVERWVSGPGYGLRMPVSLVRDSEGGEEGGDAMRGF